MDERQLDIIRLANRLTREEVLNAGIEPESCVISVRVLIDTLRSKGVLVKPASVTVTILNAEASDLLLNHGMEHAVQELAKWDGVDVGGPWSIGLGFGKPEDGVGHVVAAFPALRTIADPSLDQSSRPHKNLLLGPSVFAEIDTAWFTGEKKAATVAVPQRDGHATLIYEHADHERFRKSPGWTRVSGGDPYVIPMITEAVLLRMSEESR